MMDRAQFMQELEKLLADISETERQDALDFYNSYFDDAGAENEASVLRELGSPEKVAAIIKADLKGSAGGYEYGEYTEHGYEDARTKERGQMPERYEEESGTGKRFFRKGNQAVLILAVILLVFISPFIKGAVGGILTFAVGILLLPFWLIVGLGIGAMALLVGGIAAVVAGAGLLAVMTGTGIMTIGIGCLMIALAILMILGLISIAVRIVPKWFRKITDFLTGCFTERERRRLNEEVYKRNVDRSGDFWCCGNRADGCRWCYGSPYVGTDRGGKPEKGASGGRWGV